MTGRLVFSIWRQNSFLVSLYVYAHACVPTRRYERVYVYNKVFGTKISAKQDESVKILLISKLFLGNIW